VKRRVLFVGRSRYRLPLAPSVAHKFDALRAEVDVRVLASAAPGSAPGDDTFVLVRQVRPRIIDGLSFWLLLPFRVARELREFRPDAVIAQTAHDAAAALLARRLARVPARIVAEVHGDWRTSTRLYGSSARRVLSGAADAVAAFALKRADAVRTVSPFTAGLVRDLGVEPTADFPAYMDLEPFTRAPEPLPAAPLALFVGVLEAYKNVDGLAAAWRMAQTAGDLRIVGKGSRENVVRELGVRWDAELPSEEIARALDEAWILVLPSRSEGMGRVLVEAFCRGRGVIGSRAGSIPNLVEDGVSGILVDSNEELARALERVLGDRALAERLGAGAREAAAPWLQTPEEYAKRIAELVA
jgi:glycosyltransferase involved in cell wall biosynthesis